MKRHELVQKLARAHGGDRARYRGDDDLNPGLGAMPTLVPAAVLVPIIEHRSGPTVLLTLRTGHLRDHAGQISFPGGRIEPADTSHEAAALREAEEEIGLAPEWVELVGRLDTYRTRTGFEITPVVGLVRPGFPVRLDDFEVAEIFEVPLTFVLDRGNYERRNREFGGRMREFYVLPYGAHYIWGATAGMLVNLCEVMTVHEPKIADDPKVGA